MKLFSRIIALGALLLAAGTASAAYIPATWSESLALNERVGYFGQAEYTHDLTNVGFVPGQDIISNFWLSLDLRDDRDLFRWEPEIAIVDLPGAMGDSVVTNFGLSGSEYGGWSIAGLIELNVWGTLSVTVHSLVGDFVLTSSNLVANGYANVPEPGTLALMGIGLLGVGLASRRRRLTK